MKPNPQSEEIGSPENYQNHTSDSSYYQKSAYHQTHAQPAQYPQTTNGHNYGTQQNGGMQYPTPMAAQAQFYPPAGTGYFPSAYPTSEHAVQYYLVPGAGGSWAMQPVSFYSPQAYGQPGSPPGTPQVQLTYGYQVPPVSDQDMYSGAQSNGGNANNIGVMNVPELDHRRNSWSSSGTDAPITSFTTTSDQAPAIFGDSRYPMPSKPLKAKTLTEMIKSGPPIPTPVHGPYISRGYGHSNLENPTHTTNVYVRGLPPDTDDDKLLEMTARFGKVTSHKAIVDTEHGTCKGYGFARYATVEEAQNCIRGLTAQNYEAGFARESFNARLKTLADPNSTNIYVSNLPCDMNEKDMQEIFSDYVVVSNRILRDTNGLSRGVGFARFESREICDTIIRDFHGKPIGSERLPLQVRYADTSAQKRLKATTARKRPYRPNEYSNYGHGGPYHDRFNPRFQNRGWQRSTDSHGSDYSVDTPFPQYASKQFYKYNKGYPKSYGVSDGAQDRAISEDPTDPNAFNQSRSCGSFSDPGDSYGGREYTDGITA